MWAIHFFPPELNFTNLAPLKRKYSCNQLQMDSPFLSLITNLGFFFFFQCSHISIFSLHFLRIISVTQHQSALLNLLLFCRGWMSGNYLCLKRPSSSLLVRITSQCNVAFRHFLEDSCFRTVGSWDDQHQCIVIPETCWFPKTF